MRFLFVDKILEIKKGSYIKGIKTVNFEECFLKSPYKEEGVFPSLLILEAIAQLTSWLVIYSTDFKFKALLVKAEKIEIKKEIKCGTVLILETEILSLNDDGVFVRGNVKIGDTIIATGNNCIGKTIPLEDLNDLDEVKASFAELTKKAIIA